MIWRPGILGVMLGCLIANVVEPSQAQQGLPRIWDIQLGSHVSTLPRQEFVEPACGNRGGPKGRVLAGFEAYASCAAEPDGLREVWFMYDDTREFVELARREPVRRRATTILDQPVILSLLISKRGYIQGYRIHTDPRAPESLRLQAHQVALHFKARFGVEDSCTDLASGDGETPVEGEFIKEHCLASVDGRSIVIDRRFYYRAGQQTADPNTGERMTNAFESSASLELRLEHMLERPVPKAATVVAADDPRSILLQGRSRNCPGCQLKDVDLRYRNLEGAHLEGADLSGALLHAANLRGADLRHANLDRANLNRANLGTSVLTGASAKEAMLFQSDLQRADLEGADLSQALMGRANLTLARAAGASFEHADLGEARLSEADFSSARMGAVVLAQATLVRAKLPGAQMAGANLAGARMHRSDLSQAQLSGADLSSADLSEADLTGADLTGASLLSADLSAARLRDTRLIGARMPDNSRHP